MMKQLSCRSVSINIAGFLFLLLILQLRPTMSEEVEDEREFDYLKNSSKGPEHWGELHEEWAACKNGHMQSPIDLLHERVQVVLELGKIRRNYRTANATLKNRGHDIMEWECIPNTFLEWRKIGKRKRGYLPWSKERRVNLGKTLQRFAKKKT